MSKMDEPDKQTDTHEHIETRRDSLTRLAIDPVTGKEFEVILSYSRVQKLRNRSLGQKLECARIVPEVLRYPKAIFQGLKRDADERGSKVKGWRCYCGVPSRAFTEDGTEVVPWPGQTFMVFMNIEKVVYLWYWYPSDEDDPNIPWDHVPRFDKKAM